MSEFPIDDEIAALVDRWCDRRDLRALRLILDGWPRVSGLTDEWGQCRDRVPRTEAEVRREVGLNLY